MQNILFVCIENSCRSQMAEAFAKIHGANIINAYSCGSAPSGVVNPRAINFMQEVNYDLSIHESQSADMLNVDTFDYVIGMGCGDQCPVLNSRHHLNWEIKDPKLVSDHEFRQIRDQIEKAVKTLLLNL